MPPPRHDHFIPFRKSDVVSACSERLGLSERDAQSFRAFARILESVTHFEFQEQLERLKESFAPANPDSDTRRLRSYTRDEREALQAEFVERMKQLLAAANFVPITREDLERSLDASSLFKVRLQVDFDDFEDVLFFRRGEQTRKETIRELFGLRRREIEFINYERVVIYVRFREAGHFSPEERGALAFEPGSSLIKLFRDVPKADLEMLFPNTTVGMRLMDKLMIGVPAAAGSVSVLVTKLGTTIVLLASLLSFWLGFRSEPVTLDQAAMVSLGAGLAALGGFLWRQLTKFKNRKIRFMKLLTENLYFKNLDNGAGVFHRLLDSAEEEEVKEMILAYTFLMGSDRALRSEELDAQVESWFEKSLDCELDFEVADALQKLERLGLASCESQAWRAVSLETAQRTLDTRWDEYFDYRGLDDGGELAPEEQRVWESSTS